MGMMHKHNQNTQVTLSKSISILSHLLKTFIQEQFSESRFLKYPARNVK